MCIAALRLLPRFILLAYLLSAGASFAGQAVIIVAFGDSTTAPRGAIPVYARLLQEELQPVQVINAGVPGNTTEMARRRFDRDVIAKEPRIAIVQFGINDSAIDVWKTPPATDPRVPKPRYEENLRYFVRTLKARQALVFLMTPNPLRWTAKLKEMYGMPPYQPNDPDGFNVTLKEYCDVVRRVAQEEGAELIDLAEACPREATRRGISVDALLLDGMHPNDAGHRLVADLLRDRILAAAPKHRMKIERRP